jgi:hypothetical protein
MRLFFVIINHKVITYKQKFDQFSTLFKHPNESHRETSNKAGNQSDMLENKLIC